MPRGISLTYGQSTMNGRFLTTGRVKSANGLTYFDLDTNEIAGAIKFIPSGGGLKLVSETDDLAKAKSRVFVTTPTTPYEVGDLWTDGTNIRRCNVTRLTGSYNAADWGLAADYDRTQTVIDGGLVTSGTLQVGNSAFINAGVTGNGASGVSIRFWAGSTFANRATAPFRVLDNGSVVMTNATVTGTINATAGSIAGVTISATDQFSLNGSKVELFPNAGLRVFGAGYADFTNATLKIPTVVPSGLANGEASIWIGSLSGISSVGGGGGGASLMSDLLDVNLTGLVNGDTLQYSSGTSKWIRTPNISGNAASATVLQTARTIQGVSFNGSANINIINGTGFVKAAGTTLSYVADGSANWNTAFGWGNHAGRYPTYAGVGATGTWGIAITGNAASASVLQTARTINGVSFNGSANITIVDSTKAPLNGAGASGTWGISITGSAGSAQNATQWGGQYINTTVATGAPTNPFGWDAANGVFRPFTWNAFASGLGLGTAAFVNSAISAVANTVVQRDSNGHLTGTNFTSRISVGGGTGTAYNGANIELVGTGRAPNISFHWSGVIASSIGIESNGRVAIRDNPGTGYENLIVKDIYATTFYASGWFYSQGTAGLYNNTHGSYFYSNAGGHFAIAGNANDSGRLNFLNNNLGIGQGSVYWDAAGFGFLNKGGNWAVRVNASEAANAGGTLFGTWTATGDMIGFSTSDGRLKNNVRPILNALSMVRQMGGYYYEWNATQTYYKAGTKDLGMIAQEVERVLPEVVTTRDSGYKAMRYEKIIPVHNRAIIELEDKFLRETTFLKQRIADLERRLN